MQIFVKMLTSKTMPATKHNNRTTGTVTRRTDVGDSTVRHLSHLEKKTCQLPPLRRPRPLLRQRRQQLQSGNVLPHPSRPWTTLNPAVKSSNTYALPPSFSLHDTLERTPAGVFASRLTQTLLQLPTKTSPFGVVPFLRVKSARKAVTWYEKALNATVEEAFEDEGTDLLHFADIAIPIENETHHVWISDDFPEYNGGKSLQPHALGGTPVVVNLLVPDADQWYASAVGAGAQVVSEIATHPWGARAGTIQDPFGHHWTFMTELGPQQQQQEGEGEGAGEGAGEA